MRSSVVLEKITSIDGWLSENESILLYVLARVIPVSGEIVEIGSYKGKSTVALAMGLIDSGEAGFVWAVDPHEGIIEADKGSTHGDTHKEFVKNIKKARVESRVRDLVMTSEDAARRWKRPIRLLFIDGLHDFTHAASDYAYWAMFLTRGSVLAFHDAFCGEEGVWQAVRAHALRRKDVVDIGCVGSILYLVTGKRTKVGSLRVLYKKTVVYFSIFLNSSPLPWTIKKIVIHRFLRILLLTRYTRLVYKK